MAPERAFRVGNAERTAREPVKATYSRRETLRIVGTSGAGFDLLNTTIRTSLGNGRETTELVWREDQHGNPATTRAIRQARYDKLRTYLDLEDGRFDDPPVLGRRLTQQSSDPTDLALTIEVPREHPRPRQNLPSEVDGLPVTIERSEPAERTLADDGTRNSLVCDDWMREWFDPVPANVPIDSPHPDVMGGTVGVVGWDDDRDDCRPCYLTAAHTMHTDDEYAESMTQWGYDDDGTLHSETRIGTFEEASSSSEYDVVKYRHDSTECSPDTLANEAPQLSSVEGTWTFSGLTDATTGEDSVACGFAGKQSCYVDCSAFTTATSHSLDESVRLDPDTFVGGDSGGPFVDDDGYLVGFLSALHPAGYAIATPAAEALDAVDMTLSCPHSAGSPRPNF